MKSHFLRIAICTRPPVRRISLSRLFGLPFITSSSSDYNIETLPELIARSNSLFLLMRILEKATSSPILSSYRVGLHNLITHPEIFDRYTFGQYADQHHTGNHYNNYYCSIESAEVPLAAWLRAQHAFGI